VRSYLFLYTCEGNCLTTSIIITFVDGKQSAEIESICAEYLKRITWKIALNRIQPSKHTDIALAKKAETDAVLAKVQKSQNVVILTEHAKPITSHDFKDFMQDLVDSPKQVHFIISGAYGFDDKLLDISHKKLSLSALTFPHKIAKMLLIEQIYRAYMIIANKQYHY